MKKFLNVILNNNELLLAAIGVATIMALAIIALVITITTEVIFGIWG